MTTCTSGGDPIEVYLELRVSFLLRSSLCVWDLRKNMAWSQTRQIVNIES